MLSSYSSLSVKITQFICDIYFLVTYFICKAYVSVYKHISRVHFAPNSAEWNDLNISAKSYFVRSRHCDSSGNRFTFQISIHAFEITTDTVIL